MLTRNIHVTQHGLGKLNRELSNLKSKHQQQLERLRSHVLSRETRDAMYSTELIEQNETTIRISELENALRHAEIIRNRHNPEAGLGSTLEIESDSKTIHIVLVDSIEADPFNDRVSIYSPLGKALEGHKRGESVSITTPKGDQQSYTINRVS